MRRILFSAIAVALLMLESCGERDRSSSGIDTGNSQRNRVQVDTAEITGTPNIPDGSVQTTSTK